MFCHCWLLFVGCMWLLLFGCMWLLLADANAHLMLPLRGVMDVCFSGFLAFLVFPIGGPGHGEGILDSLWRRKTRGTSYTRGRGMISLFFSTARAMVKMATTREKTEGQKNVSWSSWISWNLQVFQLEF